MEIIADPSIATVFKTQELLEIEVVFRWTKHSELLKHIKPDVTERVLEICFADEMPKILARLHAESKEQMEFEKLWAEECEKTYPASILEPQGWLNKGKELLRSASILWTSQVEKELKVNPRWPDGLAVFQMLCGFALENLLKGLIVARTSWAKPSKTLYASDQESRQGFADSRPRGTVGESWRARP